MSSDTLFALSSAETSTFREVGLPKELWDHQRAALEYIARARKVLVADEVGVGKTAAAIAAIRLLNAYPLLVVPPAYLRYTWQRAMSEWQPDVTVRVVEPGERLILPGSTKDPDVYIVSYNLLGQQERQEDGAPKDGANSLVRALMRTPLKGLICDEAHALKTTTSLRQKAVRRVAMGIGVRLLLGANPIESRPRELIPQLEIIDQMAAFGSKWRFQQRYCNVWGEGEQKKCAECMGTKYSTKTGERCRPCRGTGGAFGKWDFSGAKNLDELHRKLRSTCMIQRDKAQVHKSLPALTAARVDLEISNRRDYMKAENDYLGWLNENAKTLSPSALRALAMIRLNGLKQLAALGKREAAEEWIAGFLESNPEQKLVLFTFYRETALHFGERFDARVIIGGTPIPKREEYIAAFQDPKSTARVIVVNVQAGGTGIELYAASNCVFLELDWLPTTHSQAAGRLHRPGQTRPVTAWWLVGAGTVEGPIFDDVLAEKARVVRNTLRGSPEPGEESRDLLGFLRGFVPNP